MVVAQLRSVLCCLGRSTGADPVATDAPPSRWRRAFPAVGSSWTSVLLPPASHPQSHGGKSQMTPSASPSNHVNYFVRGLTKDAITLTFVGISTSSLESTNLGFTAILTWFLVPLPA